MIRNQLSDIKQYKAILMIKIHKKHKKIYPYIQSARKLGSTWSTQPLAMENTIEN